LWSRKGKAFCEHSFALDREKPKKDKQNVDLDHPGKISADARGSLLTAAFGHSHTETLHSERKWRFVKGIRQLQGVNKKVRCRRASVTNTTYGLPAAVLWGCWVVLGGPWLPDFWLAPCFVPAVLC